MRIVTQVSKWVLMLIKELCIIQILPLYLPGGNGIKCKFCLQADRALCGIAIKFEGLFYFKFFKSKHAMKSTGRTEKFTDFLETILNC